MTRRAWAGVVAFILLGLGSGYLAVHEVANQAHQKAAAQEAASGQQLFVSMCATCHGPDGNGAGGAPVLDDGRVLGKYPTLSALSHFIQTRMPATDPGMLSTAQAQNLAVFINKVNHRLP